MQLAEVGFRVGGLCRHVRAHHVQEPVLLLLG
jgi:hypothetical protein